MDNENVEVTENADKIVETIIEETEPETPSELLSGEIQTPDINVPVDAAGNKFYANIYESNEDGTPRFTKNGYFRRKRGAGGRKLNVPENQANEAGENLGDMAGELFFSSGTIILGQDFAPDTNEDNTVKKAFGAYFKNKDMKDIPPNVMLAGVLLTYIASRFRKPTIKEKIYLFFSRISGWFKRKKKNAHADSGDNGNG